MSDHAIRFDPDPLAELVEAVIAEGRALGVAPEVLLRMTAEAFDFLGARTPRPPVARTETAQA
ncbi:MAG TPA: hypothetical protein VF746_20100 [Longimicrobium sp.]|jgi:hypothetical protein